MSYAANIERQLSDQLKFFEETFQNQSWDRCRHNPAPGAWNALQCIQHVNMTLDFMIDAIDKGMEKALAAGQQPSEKYRPGFIATRFARLLAPQDGDVKRKVKTSKKFQPEVPAGTEAEVLEGFRTRMERVRQQVETSQKVDLNKCRVNSTISSLLKFKLGDSFPILLAHNERHIFQARKALRIS